MVRRMVLMAAGFALVAAACGTGSVDEAEVVSAPPPATDEPAAEDDAPAEDEGSNEGIEVHGHWKIVVTNPDGTVASTTDFENALLPSGADGLADFLSEADASLDGWFIRAIGTGEAWLSDPDAPKGAFDCQLPSSGGCINRAEASADGGPLSLVSTLYGKVDGEITEVGTRTGFSTAAGSSFFNFTARVLDTPVPFVADQQIDITVEISFS